MRAARTQSIGVRASSRLALVIAREIELLATRHRRLLAFDVEELEAVAEHLAGLVAQAMPTGLVDAKDLAKQLGVDRDWFPDGKGESRRMESTANGFGARPGRRTAADIPGGGV